MRRQYTLLEEPQGAEYTGLLRTLSRFCQYALLVVRPEIPLSPYGQETLQELEQDIVIQEARQEWPGTRLYGGNATVYLVRLSSRSLEILCQRADRLYEWSQPLLPEDLCLMRTETEPLLVSISHERDAYLLLSDDEKRELLSAVPSFRIGED
ncbi:MAG: hypothetical protein KatS3mg016_1754 [Fimbriimonadales bacterium]|jgi:hypothetical protein|nr:MAG: hypothetical protein D6697_11225 [Armatimonadota bacterium]GIV06179.1 MAG: hypothetical protein KatS3mg016_1754 [Fimbriimonadales bacterium]GIV07816.1 MAG: hypothetical protein KatS3mg017_1018 [Fimbriimonadales bacterium]